MYVMFFIVSDWNILFLIHDSAANIIQIWLSFIVILHSVSVLTRRLLDMRSDFDSNFVGPTWLFLLPARTQ